MGREWSRKHSNADLEIMSIVNDTPIYGSAQEAPQLFPLRLATSAAALNHIHATSQMTKAEVIEF